MVERKAAIINISKGLLNVSLTALTAIGGATGNPLLAGAAVLPQALASSGTLSPLFEKKAEQHLELPIPPWWTKEPQSQSWQNACSSIEHHLPEIIKSVEKQIGLEKSYPSPSTIKAIFIQQVERQLSWEVNPQDRALVAGYVTPPLLEKAATALQSIITSTREDALEQWLVTIAAKLDTIQKSPLQVVPPPLPSASTTAQTSSSTTPVVESIRDQQIIAANLAQKWQNDAYDVYICYDETDEIEVMGIGEKLKEEGILPWFDFLGVRPGTLAKSIQQAQIRKIPAAAVFVGQNKIVDLQELQMYSFIDEFIYREIPVIPVLLTNTPRDLRLPPYLGNFGKVDFRRSMPEPMGQLIWGITGHRP